MKHLLTISIISLIALAFWGLQSYEDKNIENITDEASPHFVDVFMRDFTLTAMDDNGKPSYTLQASSFEHYKDSTLSLLEKPVIHLLQANHRWEISALNGEIDDDHRVIILHNDVIMKQQHTDFPIYIKTSHLKIDTEKQIARSDQTVNIFHQKIKLQSKGMQLNNTSGELELLASVKGNYVEAD